MSNNNDDGGGGCRTHNIVVTIRVAVGSGNPAKINAVRAALERAANTKKKVVFEVEGFSCESGVAAQPVGDDETLLGGKNRAKAVYQSYRNKNNNSKHEPPHLAVGLEGGLEWSSDQKILWCMAWMCCYGKRTQLLVDVFGGSDVAFGKEDEDEEPIWGYAKAASYAMPPPITELIKQGLELGDADDKVFNRVNSKQKSGTVGILTNGAIDRSAYYEHALILALVPWIRPDVYPHGCTSQLQNQNGNNDAIVSTKE